MGETVHRTLVLLGLAEDEVGEPVEETQLEALERQVAENTAEIEALRAELEQLRGERWPGGPGSLAGVRPGGETRG